MKLFSRISVCLLVVVTIVGCASTSSVTGRHEYKGGKIARPNHILVYDFAPPRNVPAESASAVQSACGEIAKALVEDIRGMGLPAKRRTKQSKRERAAHIKLRLTSLTVCPKCKKTIRPHRACQHCGYYRGRDVLLHDTRLERRKKREKKKEDRKKS